MSMVVLVMFVVFVLVVVFVVVFLMAQVAVFTALSSFSLCPLVTFQRNLQPSDGQFPYKCCQGAPITGSEPVTMSA